MSIEERRVDLQADSLCIHTDTPHAVEFVRLIRDEIESSGIPIVKPRDL
jgi:lactam utilization protein B